MTTVVYKKGKWIAADKRAVGWEIWYTDQAFKIFTHVWDNYKIYLWFSWRSQIREIINWILSKHFWKEFDPAKLLDFREDLVKASTDSSFGTVFVYQKLEFDKPHEFRVFHVDTAWISEAYSDFVAAWTWSSWVDWILTAVPDIDPDKLFELVSSKDLNTSSTYDIINFN